MAGEREKFIAFLNAKKVFTNCEACGANKWGIPATPSGGLMVSVPIAQFGSISIPGPSIPAYVMVCENCGNIRTHASSIVDRG